VTNNTYIFNSSLLNQADAQATCKVTGGHLAAWISLEEQVGPAECRQQPTCRQGGVPMGAGECQ
jgi:hypothetical protein